MAGVVLPFQGDGFSSSIPRAARELALLVLAVPWADLFWAFQAGIFNSSIGSTTTSDIKLSAIGLVRQERKFLRLGTVMTVAPAACLLLNK